MDRFRIVSIASNGRPIPVRDLNDGSTVSLIRDTLSFTPPAVNTLSTASGRRFEGSTPVQQSHANAQAACELYVGDGVMSADAALELGEQIANAVCSVNPSYKIEWRPEGSSRSLYLELRGPGESAMQYRWIEWQGTKKLHIKLSWQTAPLALGDQTWVYEDFLRPDRTGTPGTGNTGLGDYTVTDAGGATSYIDANGKLVFTGNGLKTYIYTARGYKAANAEVSMLFNVASAPGSGDMRVYPVYIDANNYIEARVNLATGNWTVTINVAGTPSSSSGTSTSALATGIWWLRVRKVAAVVQVDIISAAASAVDSMPSRLTNGSGASKTATVTLTGPQAAVFAPAGGYQGFAVTPPTGGAANIDVRRVYMEPFAGGLITNSTTNPTPINPASIDFGSPIPGTAPALVDVDIALDASTSGSALPWALLSWWPAPTLTPKPWGPTPQGPILPPLGFWDADLDYFGITGWSPGSAAAAGVSGANALKDTTVSGGDTFAWYVDVDPSIVEPDDFTNEIKIELWARLHHSGGLTSLLCTPSAFPVYTAESAARYTVEWGSAGRLLPLPTSGLKTFRLGVLSLPVDKLSRTPWRIRLDFAAGNASTGEFWMDWVASVPARGRATTPTGKANDAAYPGFMKTPTTLAVRRRIYSNMTGAAGLDTITPDRMSPSRGLSGSQIVIPGGRTPQVMLLTSTQVPDDPTVAAGEGSGVTDQTFILNLRVQPRYYLVRGTT